MLPFNHASERVLLLLCCKNVTLLVPLIYLLDLLVCLFLGLVYALNFLLLT